MRMRLISTQKTDLHSKCNNNGGLRAPVFYRQLAPARPLEDSLPGDHHVGCSKNEFFSRPPFDRFSLALPARTGASWNTRDAPTPERLIGTIPDLPPRFLRKLHTERPAGQFLCNFRRNHDGTTNLVPMASPGSGRWGSQRSGTSRCPRAAGRLHRENRYFGIFGSAAPPATRSGPHEAPPRGPLDESTCHSASTQFRG